MRRLGNVGADLSSGGTWRADFQMRISRPQCGYLNRSSRGRLGGVRVSALVVSQFMTPANAGAAAPLSSVQGTPFNCANPGWSVLLLTRSVQTRPRAPYSG